MIMWMDTSWAGRLGLGLVALLRKPIILALIVVSLAIAFYLSQHLVVGWG